MNRILSSLCLAAAVSLALAANAQAPSSTPVVAPLSKDGYATAKKDAETRFSSDREGCSSASGNARDICMAEAKGRERVAIAEANAAYENTPKSREALGVAHAQAVYAIAIERCDDFAGNRKDVCVKEAKSGLVKGKADAKVNRVAAVTHQEGAAKRAEARDEANADKDDARFKVAAEKCEALAGPSKEACQASAKAKFGKS